MENPIILVLYFFESFCITLLGGVLFNYSSPQNIKTLAKISLFSGLFLYVIRNLVTVFELPVIIHMPFTMLLLMILLYKIAKVDKLISILTVVLGYVAILFNESTVVYFYLKTFNIATEQIAANVYLHLGIGLLNDVTLLLTIGLIYFIKKITRKEKELDVKEIGIRIK